ncbi:hypothetical protein BX070DRAFT_193427, partial [Coemansia spiralis]
VYMLDKYKTSSLCSGYLDDELRPFKWTKHGRCYRRNNRLRVKWHGLLHCKNDKCLENTIKYVPGSPLPTHYWDRDTAAALNYRHIFKSFCSEENKSLERFSQKSQSKPQVSCS